MGPHKLNHFCTEEQTLRQGGKHLSVIHPIKLNSQNIQQEKRNNKPRKQRNLAQCFKMIISLSGIG